MILTLPLPARDLQPNKLLRVHWAKRSRLVNKARGEARLVASNAAGSDREWNQPELRATFYMRSKREMLDDDGATGWLKSYRDGIADALGINDRCMRTAVPVQLLDPNDPRVVIEIVER